MRRLQRKNEEEDMNEILLTAGICISGGLAGFASTLSVKPVRVFKKQTSFRDLLMRGIGLLLFVVYMPYLFSLEFMSQQKKNQTDFM